MIRRVCLLILVLVVSYLALAMAHAQEPARLWLSYDASMLPPALKLAKTQRVVEVLNVNNGPGVQRDIAYGAHVVAAREIKTLTLIGYIDLVTWRGEVWTLKTPAMIETERQRWRAMYGIGVFWYDDCFADEPAIKELMQSLTWDATKRQCFANAGAPGAVNAWLRSAGFIVCDFEDPATRPSWDTARGPCVITFITAAQWPAVYRQAKARKISYLGVEDIAKHHNGEFQSPLTWWKLLQ